MSRKNNDHFVDGCIGLIWPIFIIFAPVIFVLNFVVENIGIVLIVAAVAAVIIGIVFAAKSAANKKAAEEAERQKNLTIVNALESKPTLISIPTSSSFSCAEEAELNRRFREFLTLNNSVIEAQAHDTYLQNKIKALRALGRMEEANQLETEAGKASAVLAEAKAKRTTYDSKNNSILYRNIELKNAFTSFASKIASTKIELVGDFFQSPLIKMVKADNSSVLIFTPGYIASYSTTTKLIKVVPYRDASISTYITTEILNGPRQTNDEIEHIGYLYETKDGRRDMRYSYENNPSYTFVYRGTATIRCNSVAYEQKFSNKSFTEAFEKNFNAYIALVSGKYKPVIEQVLKNESMLVQAGSVEAFLSQQAAAEKVRKEAEKIEREKQEKARAEREAVAAAKRKREQEERAAIEREKKRKDDLMRNLSIVDGVLTNWYGSEKAFVLPKGLVTVIGTAFRWKNNLESIELPDGITEIQANAFHGTSSLKRIVIPSTVSSIGKEAFFGCSSLAELTLPRGIKSIASQMLGKCSSLKTITIPAGVKKIEQGAFTGCSSLTEIIVPEGVLSIEDDAFENCIKLKKVILPNSLTKLGKNVFSGCIALEQVVLGCGIKRIPDACFANHQKLQYVTVSADIVEICDRAFKNCYELKELRYIEKAETSINKGMAFERMILGDSFAGAKKNELDSLERIGKSAFENCFAFKGIELRKGLRSIGDYAFANCRSIREITLVETISSFGQGTFLGCTSLEKVEGSSYVNWQKRNCFTGAPWLASIAVDDFVIFEGYLEAYTGTESTVQIPETVKTIGRSAFDGNAYVIAVQIPISTTVIEEMAFANCKKLKSVYIPDSVTQIEDNAFVGDTEIMIQCSRGSAASAFRIRNKLSGEYVAKAKPIETKGKTAMRKSKGSIGDGLSGLSEEELRVIMEMRREKIAQKKAEKDKVVEPEVVEYTMTQYDATKVEIKLVSETKTITNNIFNLKFEQNTVVSGTRSAVDYEAFVIDAYGQIISDIRTICANKTGSDLTHKVTFSLSAQEKFDKTANYYVVIRYKEAGKNILSKTQYRISIDFVSDFDF